MSFTSLYFPAYLLLTLCLYYLFAKKAFLQNTVIIIASIIFYSIGHIHYFIIWASLSTFTYLMALGINKFSSFKKHLSFIGIMAIVSFFLLIKYSTMFADVFNFKLSSSISSFELLQPVGLSFYSFTSIGYLADVYNGRVKACLNIPQFFAFSSFFPQILSGPISFADQQLPQFEGSRKFSLENVKEGLPFIVWGLFKKVVIANTFVKPIAYIFSHNAELHGISLLIGLLIYSIQVYADFSGYSDMAYGIAKLFGIKVPLNFKMPYFSKNISEYWRTWHSSLSKWFGRYIYIPLGGNKSSFTIYIRNIIIIFTISGLWHGANLKFIFWGLLNGCFYIVYLLSDHIIKNKSTRFSTLVTNSLMIPSGMLLTFLSVTIARVYFRSESFEQGNDYLYHMLNNTNLTLSVFGMKYVYIAALFMTFEWLKRKSITPLELTQTNKSFQVISYLIVIGLITYSLQQPQSTEHIYFKF